MTDFDTFSELRCVVLGSYVADCVIKTATLPSWGDDIRAQSIVVTPGGKAANQAVALARMGAHVSVIGRVGADAVGMEIMDHLRRNAVDTTSISIKPDVATPVCLVLSGEDNQKSITWHVSEELETSVRQVQEAEALIADANVMLLTFELPPVALNAALRLAREHGTKVVLNAAPRRSEAELADVCFEGVTCLVVNEVEARRLFGHAVQSAAIAEFALLHDIELICLTRGSHGCSYWRAGRMLHQPATPVTGSNSAGAGDAFVAALALYCATDHDYGVAVHGACVAGGLAVEGSGTLSSMPTARQLGERLVTRE